MGDTQVVPAEDSAQSPKSDMELYRTFDSFPWSKTVPFLVRSAQPLEQTRPTNTISRGLS